MTHPDLTGRSLGEFVIGERLGEGGHGTVYRAHQPALGRDVVVKVLRPQRRGCLVAQERFLREAKLASLLDHPFAAHVYAFDVDKHDGLMWIAMELVHGVTLEHWLETHGAMPLHQLVPFMEGVTRVVQAAHMLGIVHRDLKPSNIMVIEQDGEVLPKLLDFGVAKAPPEATSMSMWGRTIRIDPACRKSTARLRGTRHQGRITETDPRLAEDSDPTGEPVQPEPLTRPGSCLGSSAYMAPEQWHDAVLVGPAADIYSLGVITYRALTGSEPFSGDHHDDYYRHHQYSSPPRLRGELAAIDPVIQRALAKSPRKRQTTAVEFAAELRSALRASAREQLRTAAQQWEDRKRSPGLLWGREELPHLEHWSLHRRDQLSSLECSFVAASQRRARRALWLHRVLVLTVAALVVVGLEYRSMERARVAEARAVQAELEQGRSALLHGEPEALPHLRAAYQRDPSPSTAFMLARALQPHLAEQLRLSSPNERVWSAVFSPDEKQIATSDDHQARIWDAQTGRLVHVLEHGTNVYQVAYSTDGARIYSAGGDGAVRVWDAASGQMLHKLTRISGDGIRAQFGRLATSPEGDVIVAADINHGIVDVWDSAKGTLIIELMGDSAGFPNVVFTPMGLAVTGGQDVRIYDSKTWKLSQTIHQDGVRTLAVAPGAGLAVGTADGDVSVWNEHGRTHVREVGESVDALAFSSDGRLLAAGGHDGTVQIWRLDAAAVTRHAQFNIGPTKVLVLEFDATSERILAAGVDGTLTVADASQGVPLAALAGSSALIWSAHFDHHGKRIVSASWDGVARVWSAEPQYRRWSVPAPGPACDMDTMPGPDGRYLAVGCRGSTIRVWDTAQARLLAELPGVTPVEGDFLSAFPAVSSSGDRAAIAHGNSVDVYELPGGRRIRSVDHPAPVNAVAFSPGGDIVSGDVAGSLFVTRDDGTLLRLRAASGGIDAIAALPDGRILAADASHHLRVFERGGMLLADLGLPFRVISLRPHADRLVALPSFLGSIEPPVLIDLERYHIVATLNAHVGRVFSARWSAGSRVLTAGGDGTARLWDGRTGEPLQVYRGRRLLTDAVAFDGMVVGGGADGLLRFWDQQSGRQLWEMPAFRAQVVSLHVEPTGLVARGIAGELGRWLLAAPDQIVRACDGRDDCDIVSR